MANLPRTDPRGAAGSRWGREQSSVAAHVHIGGDDGDDAAKSGQNSPAEYGESAVKPDPRAPGWIKR